ncbi:hypothetical protein [Sphingomonas jatrophae]|uniref:Glyoxalase/Bleomycin resistance protein/Dioxygenase superfamily protein n=1 Tax=Sphingomonas jatrophae TaxID=1166337 RepID=A0A1I6LHC9_9SPHN|nr:hypothetical protein [Sphingomonas jatrophae]SFS02905.1 hypothetical protein SAMN05192580_2744 [Sphingomonas jatrophae]
MIYHLSIEADVPQRVAQVLAELMGGVATPFPPVTPGSWLALAPDAHNSAVEVYPRGTQLHETPGDADAHGVIAPTSRHCATHFALGVDRNEAEVMAIAAREGWPAKYRKRDGVFGVIELWVEGCLMIEVLTPEMQAEYRQGFTMDAWLAAVARMGLDRQAA